MGGKYEIIKMKDGLSVKAFIHSINKFEMHWHKEIEILLVLQGAVNIVLGDASFLLRENDLILINPNEIHSLNKISEENILLAFQFDSRYFSYYPEFNKMIFNCKSFLHEKNNQESFDIIRHYLAKIVWEMNKKAKGYQLRIGSEAHLLGAHLMSNMEYKLLEDEKSLNKERDMERIQSIITYINHNIDKNVTLQEIAEIHQLSIYYLSHFIKDKLGMSFQKYVNQMRLDRAVHLLLNTNKTITEICYISGFPSVKSLNKFLKDIYGCSPSEYRKEYGKMKRKDIDVQAKKSRTYLDVDRTAALKKLFSYLKPLENQAHDQHMLTSSKEAISVNASKEGIHYEPYWKKLITFGRASEGLRKEWQNQLKELQADVGFEYIRFHGIFSDEMMVCNYGDGDNIAYNWSYIDELFDFFQEVNIKPFVELGFMPSEIKKSDETVFWWKANISGPKHISLWTELVKEFIKHCINRYGLKEVETWYFEVWNEPELEQVFWVEGKDAYFDFYRETALAVKSISNKLKVGGPSITHQALKDGTWLEDYLIYCIKTKTPLDFVSLHIYPETFSSREEIEGIMNKIKEGAAPIELMSAMQGIKRIYFDKDHTYDTLSSAKDKISMSLSYKPELHITEWNASANGRNLIHDTCFKAIFIIRNILKCIGKADSIGYWTFTDIMEEFKAGISAFHGGFGLINKNGLKKPSYFAYYLLSKLGEKIIAQGEEYIVTKQDEAIQILAYNYAYYDDLFLSGDTSALTNTERYSVFEEKPLKEIELRMDGLSGYYKITRYQLNRENGSVVDAWIDMGTPEDMTKEELAYLQGKAYPKISVEYLDIDGHYEEKLYVPVHGAELILIEKKIK